MPEPTQPVQAIIDLRPLSYQTSLNSFRNLLDNPSPKCPHLLVAVRTPREEMLELQVRHDDAYVIGFKGAEGWYSFDDQDGGWGKPCGVGSNYNHLGRVGMITYDDLGKLGELGRFGRGVRLDKRLCAILFAVTSEAARFSTVATYFTGLTNSVGTEHSQYLQGGVDFEMLRETYFKHWANPPEVKMEPGKVYNSVKRSILLPRNRS